jgi:tetratricopeptide (TPR) repeat protein
MNFPSSDIEVEKGKTDSKRKFTVFIIIGVLCACMVSVAGLGYLFISISRTLSPSLPSSPTLDPAIAHLSVEEKLFLASSWIQQSNECNKAMPLLDDVINQQPNNGNAYYYRSYCYQTKTNGETNANLKQQNLEFALNDVNNALHYGVTDSNVRPGDPYYVRSLIYSSMETYSTLRSERNRLIELEAENLKISVVLGNSSVYSRRSMPLLYFSMERCEEGWAELDRLQREDGLSMPPRPFYLHMAAWGHVCDGNFDKALESVDKGLVLFTAPDRVFFRALILYYLGRLDESLLVLNQLIEEKPDYNGYRYFLRAVIHYDQGNRALAEEDLRKGNYNAWGGGGLDNYLLGRMAMDDNKKELAIQYLQTADSELVGEYHPFSSKIEAALQSLGASPLPTEPASGIVATPMTIPTPTPPPDYPVNSWGFQLPPDPIAVEMEKGTGPLNINSDKYFTYLFRPSTPVKLESAQELTVHILPSVGFEETPIILLLWQPASGEWTVIPTMPRDVNVESPNSYIDSAGNIYLSIFVPRGAQFNLENFRVTLEAVNDSGDKIMLGLKP